MPVTPADIAATTHAYLQRHPGERARLQPLLDLSASATDPTDPTDQTTPPAQVTCSGVVVDRDLRVLHVRRRATGLLRCPGGHGGPTDGSLLATAVRGVAEETGIPPGALCLTPHLLDAPVDIGTDLDVDDLDPNPAGGEGAHRHYDFRFVLHLVDDEPPPVRLRPDEVTGAEWRPLAEVPSPALRAKLLRAGLTGVPEPVNASALVHDGRGRYLLHLRDNHPHIWAPGEWSLLGGGREPQDATIEATLRRELAEEAPGLHLGAVEPLTVEWTSDRHGLAVPIQIFATRWDGHPDQVGLREGVLVHWVGPEDLHRLVLRDSTRRLVQEHAAVPTTAVSTAAVPPVARPPLARPPAARPRPAAPVSDPVTRVVGVHLVLTDHGRVLLGRRHNTRYADRLWHTPASHLVPGESVTAAMVREAEEELGITIAEGDLELLHALHHLDVDGRSRVQLFFGVPRYEGALRNAEPDKCSALEWWPLDDLPADTVPYTAHTLHRIALGQRVSVLGWPA
ncbi:hypothetical protein Kpho02_75730 [Kitasatospora phosalacinea]|uniref:Nudix hydrolase domain-containing protein n=1 Tax=Kitasatospora phosalacinea TaxID=2065 RepID=A0A9W6QHZ9_9ACTN|nr:NUDIX domain-containing protein [Kitasatospora phosalacinea]GLW75276.1 hypothetical protein Kpho02_75730 [Kitasatospora phosalacinea]